MRVIKNILLILGIIFIVFNFLAFVGGVNPLKVEEGKPLSFKIAYFIGYNFLIIFGLIFIFFSFLINKKLNKRKRKKMVEELLK
jgi:hypothetical protein